MRGKLFAEIYGILKAVVPSKTSLPILRYILKDKGFCATNLDIAVAVTPKSEATEGISVYSIDRIDPIIHIIKDGKEVVFEDDKVVVDDVCYSLETINRDDYPILPDRILYEPLLVIDEVALATTFVDKMISMAAGIAKEDYRPALNGYIIDPAKHRLLTTNGHVLYSVDYEMDMAYPYEGEYKDTIAFKNVAKVLKKIKNINKFSIRYSEKYIYLHVDCDYYSVVIIASTTDGALPSTSFDKVIPNGPFDYKLILDKKMIETLFKTFGKTGLKGVEFEKVGDNLVCRSTNSEMKTELSFPLDYPTDPIERVGFNISYLKDAFDFYGADIMEVDYNDAIHAARINSFDNGDVAIVMPIRLAKREGEDNGNT